MTESSQQQFFAESLSALVDNEATELELQRLLKASQTEPEIKATWSRYQVASAVIRKDLPLFEAGDFAARVSAAIAEEDAHATAAVETPREVVQEKSHWWQNVGRFAVAATVAGGVLLFAQTYDANEAGAPVVADNNAVEAAPAGAVSLPSGYHGQPLSLRTVGMHNSYEARPQDNRQVIFVPRQSTNTQAAAPNEEIRDYLNQLIESHSDNAALNSSQGMLPFARVVFTEED
jgi:sigma-E factor negative regulatory protein RseA